MADTTKKLYESDATTTAYETAMADLGSKIANTPTYDNKYDTQLSELYTKITNREPFSYSASDDAMYQEYLKRYQQQGKLAMRDTIGQAAALTGGYGNTYAQAVGQQTYDAYLTQANEALPDYYNMALQRYNAEGDQLAQQYSMLGDLRDSAYGQYRDSMSDYYSNLGLAQNYENELYSRARYDEETAYERSRYDEETAYNRSIYDSETAYNKQQTAYTQLESVISSSGYSPSDEELAAAGMTRERANALIAEYNRQVALANEQLEISRLNATRSYSSASEPTVISANDTSTANYAQNATFGPTYRADGTIGQVSAQTYSDMSGNYSSVLSQLQSISSRGKGSATAKVALYSALKSAFQSGVITSNDYSRLRTKIDNGTL